MSQSVWLLLVALIVGASSYSLPSTSVQPRLDGICARARCILAAQDDRDKAKAEFAEVDADSADSGPKILMPPEELLNVMPREAKSFDQYLLPYAGLVLLAFGLACAAFATLVLAG